ncbi:hypothetical protein C0993_012377 [Termitomyces sp. T159_Od127]|nr:hypothetical protein C0993_012377 [Termitomyces sp. T159_Od127]
MLKYFFEIIHDPVERDRRDKCFGQMNIAKCTECMEHMGRYPVLLLNLQGFISSDATAFRNELYSKISDAVLRAARMYCTGVMSQIEKLWGQRDNSNLAGSIHKMMKPVEQSTNEGFIVLIDEYDHPQQHALEENYINR